MALPVLTIIRLLCDGDMTIDEGDGDAIVTSGVASLSCILPSLSANKIGMSKISVFDISESSLVAVAFEVAIILLICVPDPLEP